MIAAEGEQKASRALKEAAEVITLSPAALQLRYLQVSTMVLTFLKKYKYTDKHTFFGIFYTLYF